MVSLSSVYGKQTNISLEIDGKIPTRIAELLGENPLSVSYCPLYIPHRLVSALSDCNIRGSHSGVYEDSSLPACYVVPDVKQLPTFQKSTVPSSSGSSTLVSSTITFSRMALLQVIPTPRLATFFQIKKSATHKTVLTRCSPDSTSRREIRLCPSRRSSNRSPTCRLA